MKKWYLTALVTAVVAMGVQAADEGGKGEGKGGEKGGGEPVTLEMFLARGEKMAEKQGRKFDPAKAEQHFNELDKNQDGQLTADERPKRKGKKGKGKKPGGEKKGGEKKGEKPTE